MIAIIECLKKFVSDVAKILNNPRQATGGVLVGQKSEGGGGGRGMKEKQHSSVNDTIKDTFMVASAVDELDSTNTKGKQEGNVGKMPSSSTVDPNIGPTSYAKLVTGEPSRKSVNFHTLI
ncbi:hypothetical protein Tco_1024447, partial [Tanacetum coccineum]